jgi:hypothetical protein
MDYDFLIKVYRMSVVLFKISDLFTSLMKHICLVMNKINQVLEKNKLMHK